MTLEWSRPGAGETDHELLWGLVGLAAVVVAAASWASGVFLAPPCVFKALTGWPCVTCGSTRAVAALAAGDLLAALRWNPLAGFGFAVSVLYVPYAVCTGLSGTRRLRVRLSGSDHGWLRAGALGVLAATWVYLLLDGR